MLFLRAVEVLCEERHVDRGPEPKCQLRTDQRKEQKVTMSTLVVVGYDDPFQADEVLLKLRKLQREYTFWTLTRC